MCIFLCIVIPQNSFEWEITKTKQNKTKKPMEMYSKWKNYVGWLHNNSIIKYHINLYRQSYCSFQPFFSHYYHSWMVKKDLGIIDESLLFSKAPLKLLFFFFQFWWKKISSSSSYTIAMIIESLYVNSQHRHGTFFPLILLFRIVYFFFIFISFSIWLFVQCEFEQENETTLNTSQPNAIEDELKRMNKIKRIPGNSFFLLFQNKIKTHNEMVIHAFGFKNLMLRITWR